MAHDLLPFELCILDDDFLVLVFRKLLSMSEHVLINKLLMIMAIDIDDQIINNLNFALIIRFWLLFGPIDMILSNMLHLLLF